MKKSEANIEDLRNQTVSWGTHRPDDLIPKFMAMLKEYGKEAYDKYVSENPEVEDWKKLDDETKGWVVDELFDLLDGIAPEDCYFGAHPGDGADFGFWQVDESKKKESLYGHPDSKKDELAGKYYVDIENDSEGTIYRSEQEFNDYASAEEWANSELEKNADDEDVFQASIYKMFVDTDTDQLDSDLEGTIHKSDVCESKKSEKGNKDIFILDLTRIDAEGDEEGLDDMQAAQNFYDEDEAIQAAKDLADSYKDDDDVVQVTVMAGEQEKPNGDIVGEPFDIFTASSSDSATTAKYREKANYTMTDGLDYYAKGGKSEAQKSEARPTKQDAQIKELCKLCRNDKNAAESVFKALTKDYNTSLDPVLAGQYLTTTWKSKLEELGGCNGWYDGFKKLYAAMGSDFVCSVLQDLKLGSSGIGCGACITIVNNIYDNVVKRNETKKSESSQDWIAFYFCVDNRGDECAVYPHAVADREGNKVVSLQSLHSPLGEHDAYKKDYILDVMKPIPMEDIEKSAIYKKVSDGEDRDIIAIDKKDAERIMNASNPLSELNKVVQEYDSYKGEGIVNVKKSEKGNVTTFTATVQVDSSSANTIHKALEDAGIMGEDDTIRFTAKFENGYEMDIKCCGADEDVAWTEAILYDDHGHEVRVSDVSDDYFGEWELEDDNGNKYVANVIAPTHESVSESLTLKQKELKDLVRLGEAEDITAISDAEAKELKKKGVETIGVSRGIYGMNGALLRDYDGKKYAILARNGNLFYFV